MDDEKSKRQLLYKERLAVYNREAHLITGTGDTVAGRATIQVLGRNLADSPRPIGSGVLFSLDEKLFLLTAAHVADQFRNRNAALLSKGDGTVIPIWGQAHASAMPPTGKRTDDVYDYAAVRLDGRLADVLRPLAISAADIHNVPPGVIHGKGLVLVGFPARNFKFKRQTFSSSATALETYGMPRERYDRLGFVPEEHLLMQWYNTYYSSKGLTKSFSLTGMSGGGIWLVPELVGEPYPPSKPFTQPKLLGIFTEHRKSRSMLVGTKIHFHLDKIIERYPALSLHKKNVIY